jgi:hypothetical protein
VLVVPALLPRCSPSGGRRTVPARGSSVAGDGAMRAAIYDRFWHSQGGGERHSGMVGVVLSQDGVEVDLLTHQELDKDALAEHLGLDLSGSGVRLVPDKGDHEVAVVSGDYDLFVNGSYMSRLAPRAGATPTSATSRRRSTPTSRRGGARSSGRSAATCGPRPAG